MAAKRKTKSKTKKSAKKAAKKTVNKVGKKTAKKAVKKTVKKTVKKQMRKAVRKPAKTVAKKPTKKTAAKVSAPRKSLVGQPAPNFTMPTDSGGSVSLADLKGQKVILYFYPKDDTPGCTVEACAFRDTLPDFSKSGATVIGVSKDSVKSHDKFKAKYNLNFALASDENSDVCERYGVWGEKSMYGRTFMGIERSTFLIDGNGIVRGEWRKVSVTGHAEEVRAALANL